MIKNKLFLILMTMCIFQIQGKLVFCEYDPNPNTSSDFFKPPLTSDEIKQIDRSIAKQITWDVFWYPEIELIKKLKGKKKVHGFVTSDRPNHPETINVFVDETQSIYVLFRDKLFVNWAVEYRGQSMPDGNYVDSKSKILKSIPLEIVVGGEVDGEKMVDGKWTKDKIEMVEKFLEKDEAGHPENPNSQIVITCPNMDYPHLFYWVPERQYLGEMIFDPEKKTLLYDDDLLIEDIAKAGKDIKERILKIKKNGKIFKLKNSKFVPMN